MTDLTNLSTEQAAASLADGSGCAHFQDDVLVSTGRRACQFAKTAGLGDIGKSVGNWYSGLNPTAKYGLTGALAGGGLGLASGAMDEDDTTPMWSRGLTGALAGGAAGAGLGMMSQAGGQPNQQQPGQAGKPPGYMRLGDQEVVLNQDLSPDMDKQLAGIQGTLNSKNPVGAAVGAANDWVWDNPGRAVAYPGAAAVGARAAGPDFMSPKPGSWHGNQLATDRAASMMANPAGGKDLVSRLESLLPEGGREAFRRAAMSNDPAQLKAVLDANPDLAKAVATAGGTGMRPSMLGQLTGKPSLIDPKSLRGRAGTMAKGFGPLALTGLLDAGMSSHAAQESAEEQGRNIIRQLLDSGQASQYGGN